MTQSILGIKAYLLSCNSSLISISGFVWQHPAPLKGDRWEPIQGFSGTSAVGLLIDRPPSCLMNWIDTFGVTTMHVYLRNAITTCLTD